VTFALFSWKITTPPPPAIQNFLPFISIVPTNIFLLS
jgi:hypothetical protein